MMMKTTIAAAAFSAVFLPLAAEAALVKSGWNIDQSFLDSGDSVTLSYEAGGKTWSIPTFSFTANGAWADIEKVSIKFSGSATEYTLWEGGQGDTATMAVTGFTTSDDFTITYTYAPGGNDEVAVSSSFRATEVLPAVPAPAAGILLVTALAGLGVAKRRRNKA